MPQHLFVGFLGLLDIRGTPYAQSSKLYLQDVNVFSVWRLVALGGQCKPQDAQLDAPLEPDIAQASRQNVPKSPKHCPRILKSTQDARPSPRKHKLRKYSASREKLWISHALSSQWFWNYFAFPPSSMKYK